MQNSQLNTKYVVEGATRARATGTVCFVVVDLSDTSSSHLVIGGSPVIVDYLPM